MTTEYDSPTEFPPASTSLSVKAFDSSTGLITVSRAFPLRLYEGQRVQLNNTNYYVLSIDSVNTFKLKAAKVNTTAVTTGIAVGNTLVAYYELDLTSNVASSCVLFTDLSWSSLLNLSTQLIPLWIRLLSTTLSGCD